MRASRSLRLDRGLFTLLILAVLVFIPTCSIALLGFAEGLPESERYVRSFLNVPPYGNWTFVEKPAFPVYINNTQIQVGSNWIVVCPLVANHSYHIYCYGEWIDYTSNASTDYDIFVYNPLGDMEGYHTESVGLPEHLGSTVEDPFFVPKHSGNYSFVIRNDPRESKGAKQATFMIIENAECNLWHKVFIQGKADDLPVFNTSWAFEFSTESEHIEVLIRVPGTLDMYQSRLYLMADPSGEKLTLNGIPLAWEPSLYGELDSYFGGYNLETKGFGGIASASCEFYGQNMLINHTSQGEDENLYHLVFVGEEGAGTIEFLIKTEFGNTQLLPMDQPSRVCPGDEVALTFVSNSTDLRNATLYYSTDNWLNVTALNMQLVNSRTCTALIHGQPAGTIFEYRVEAPNILEDVQAYNGSFVVKHHTELNISVVSESISLGENVTLTGFVTPTAQDLPLTLSYISANGSFQQIVNTSINGTFLASFKPQVQGIWKVEAVFEETNAFYRSPEVVLAFEVGPPSFLAQYSMYIIGAIALALGVLGVFVIRRRRA